MTVNGGGDWSDPGHFIEPILPELLEDPLARLLMASDCMDAQWLRQFLIEIAKRRASCSPKLACIESHVDEDRDRSRVGTGLHGDTAERGKEWYAPDDGLGTRRPRY